MVDIYYSRIACNTYIVHNGKVGFLVDPGYNANNALIDHIKKIGVTITAILITHGHFDHISALEDILNMFPKTKVYIHDEEKEFLTNPKLNLSCEVIDEIGKELDFSPKTLITLYDGEEFEIEEFKIKCIHTPFHTKGSCCYYLANEKILFSGDSLFYTTIGRTDLPTGSNKTVESSLKKIKSLPERIKVYPGHGVITDLDREKQYNQYLRNI